jgi:TPR repeat protein
MRTSDSSRSRFRPGAARHLLTTVAILLAVMNFGEMSVRGNIPSPSRIPALTDVQDITKPAFDFSHATEPDSLSERIQSLMNSATHGDPVAQCRLGRIYDDGLWLPKNPGEAVKWFRKAADQGLAEAEYLIGRAYAFGDGVQRDEAASIGWYLKAVEQDYLPALHNLGVAYIQGRGATNVEAGIRLLKKAAEKNIPNSQ